MIRAKGNHVLVPYVTRTLAETVPVRQVNFGLHTKCFGNSPGKFIRSASTSVHHNNVRWSNICFSSSCKKSSFDFICVPPASRAGN